MAVFRRTPLLLLLLAPTTAGAAGILHLDAAGGRHELGPYIDILEDPDGQTTIDDVTATGAPFEANDTEVMSRGISTSTFWLRFVVDVPPGPDRRWLLDFGRPIYFFDLQLYTPSDDGWVVHELNESLAPRPTHVQGDALVLELPAAGPATVFVRVIAKSSMFTPLAIYSQDGFLASSRVTMWWYGAYVGIILVLVLYNLVLFFALRDRIYLWYILYVGTVGLYAVGINGITFEYLLPSTPELARRVTLGALGLSAMGAVQFCRVFLTTRATLPRLDKILFAGMVLSVLFVLGVPWAPFAVLNRAISSWGNIVIPVLIGVAAWSLVHGAWHVRFYLLALLFFFVALVVYGLTFLSVLPFTWAGYYGFQVASAVEAVLLSFALAERIRALRVEGEQLRVSGQHYLEMSLTDALTGLANRRRFDETVPALVTDAESSHQPLSLLMIDVDNFKHYNDTYGHPAGDALLKRLGEVILNAIRGADSAYRYGGEEFVVALPSTPLERAEIVAERIRESFGREIFQPRPGSAERVTVSIGGAAHITGERMRALVQRADAAMYRAKEGGKNTTVLADSA